MFVYYIQKKQSFNKRLLYAAHTLKLILGDEVLNLVIGNLRMIHIRKFACLVDDFSCFTGPGLHKKIKQKPGIKRCVIFNS